MLTEFSIGNYQAFSTPQRVPLKPITLIFGPNSAGKSSLLRSLLVARHAILNGKLSKSEGAGERHPGSYADMVRNGNSNPITFRFSVQPVGKPHEESLELELSWKEKEGAGLETTAWALTQKQAELAAYSTSWNSKHLQISNLGVDLSQIIQAANLETAEPGSETKSSLNEMAQQSIKRRLALQKNLPLPGTDADQFRTEDSKKDELDLLTFLDETHKQKELEERTLGWMRQIEAAIGSFKSAITTPFTEVDASVRDTLQKLIYHGPIRPICDEITKAQESEPGIMEWWNLAADPKLLAKVNGWLAGEVFKTQYRLEFDRLFPESSLKNVFYESFMDEVAGSAFQAKSDLDCSYRGSVIERIASDYEDAAENSLKEDLRVGEEEPSEMEIQNRAYAIAESVLEAHHYNEPGREYYEKLGPEEAEAFLLSGLEYCNQDRLRSMLGCANDGKGLKTLGGFDSARVKFSLASGRSRTSPSNMGIGFSQMMPLVASAFGSKDSLIVIEQPELHVHPALQMELADLFIESVAERNNRFLIETHSEHLILRLLRRIRETNSGALEPGKYPIRQDQVAVLYVEPGDNGSKVIELPITVDGDFSVPWPAGFFAERASELF
ncbi:AAA family ATPase [Prosthecobacter sp.]